MKRYRTKEEQEELCKEWRKSGLKQIDFCRQKGIHKKTISRWLGQLRRRDKRNKDKNNIDKKAFPFKFLSVGQGQIKDRQTEDQGILEFILPNGIRIKTILLQTVVRGFIEELVKWK